MTIRDRIKALCKEKRISLNKLEQDCGVAKGYVSKLDNSTPNATKIKKIADYLGVTVDYILNGEGYYFDKETAEMAQEIFENKDLRLLFDAAKDASPEDLKTVQTMLLALKAKG